MLNLKLRDEFLGSQMPGTAIALRDSDKKGAVERDADFILSITYPTADVQTALRAVNSTRSGRPIVLNGQERGISVNRVDSGRTALWKVAETPPQPTWMHTVLSELGE